jgi:hypothetical protein
VCGPDEASLTNAEVGPENPLRRERVERGPASPAVPCRAESTAHPWKRLVIVSGLSTIGIRRSRDGGASGVRAVIVI